MFTISYFKNNTALFFQMFGESHLVRAMCLPLLANSTSKSEAETAAIAIHGGDIGRANLAFTAKRSHHNTQFAIIKDEVINSGVVYETQ